MATPTLVRRATAVSSTTNGTAWSPSWTWGLDTPISAGERVIWVYIISADGNPTLTPSNTNLTKQGQASDATLAVTGAIFTYEDAVGWAASSEPNGGNLVGSSASEQYSAVLLAFKVSAGASVGFLLSSSAQGSSTNSNPPALTNSTGASRDLLVVATRSGDSNVVATVAPTNYGNLQTATGGGTNGASTNTAERSITVANAGSEDPGTFTSATEQWVSYTFGVYEVAAGPAIFPIVPGEHLRHLLVR